MKVKVLKPFYRTEIGYVPKTGTILDIPDNLIKMIRNDGVIEPVQTDTKEADTAVKKTSKTKK